MPPYCLLINFINHLLYSFIPQLIAPLASRDFECPAGPGDRLCLFGVHREGQPSLQEIPEEFLWGTQSTPPGSLLQQGCVPKHPAHDLAMEELVLCVDMRSE